MFLKNKIQAKIKAECVHKTKNLISVHSFGVNKLPDI